MKEEISIGLKLKLAREEKDLSQEEVVKRLAEKNLNMSRETLSKIENDKRTVSAMELNALCKILDIDINSLFEEYEENDLVTLFRRTNFSQETLEEVEIVAIGYSNQDKNLLTSSVSSISTNELLKSPAANVTNVLAGALPGVSTIQSSGQPGKDAATIFVRGSGSLFDSQSQPLVLVDGVERSFSQIDPNEIESISILKDASSTAVFGVRGANGVILVTTRRGKSGKPQINFNSSIALQQPISLIEQTGSYEFARFWNIKQQLDGVKDPKRYFTREQVEAYRTGSDPIMYPSMNWKEYIFNDLFMQTKNNVNISGGGDKVKYFVSLGYLYQNGLLKDLPGQQYDKNYRYDRFNYRANIDAKLTGTTTMKFGIGGNYNKTQEPRSVVSGTGHDQNPWIIAQIWSHPFAGPGFIDGVRTRVPQDLVLLVKCLEMECSYFMVKVTC